MPLGINLTAKIPNRCVVAIAYLTFWLVCVTFVGFFFKLKEWIPLTDCKAQKIPVINSLPNDNRWHDFYKRLSTWQMLAIEIEWAERNSSLPHCHDWADRWEKEKEVVMLSQKPRGTAWSDCSSALKDPSEGRADFPGADINCTLFQRSPFLTQPPKQAHQILSSGGKIEFPGRKEEPEPGCCWESRRAGVPAQLPQAGGPNASICCTVTCLGTSSVARLLCCPVCCCKQLPSLPAPHQRGKSPGM